MDVYLKNQEYSYHYIEQDTGYSLLYSAISDNCVALDPVATVLWKESGEVIDLAVVREEFASVPKTDNAMERLTKVINGMCRASVLENLAEQKQPSKKGTSEDVKSGKYPLKTINFYLTDECNARCYHCYQQTRNVVSKAQPAHTSQIDHRRFLAFAEEAIPLGLQDVKLTGGEPLLRSDIEDIISGLRSLNLSVCLETNAFLLTERLADLLAREVKLTAISLDGGSASRHDSIRGLAGSFDKAIQAMRMLSSRGGNVQAIMTVSKLNVSDLDSTIAVAAENGCRSFKINMLVTLGGARWLNQSEFLLDVAAILDIYRKRPEWETRYGIHVYLDGPPCFASIRDAFKSGVGACRFTNLLGVLANGSLSYCGIGNSCPELVFGNIFDENFEIRQFWREAPPLRAIRNDLSGKLDGVCAQCVFETSCKGSCRAFAYSEYQSFRKPHPWCQKAFEEGLFPAHYLIPGKPS